MAATRQDLFDLLKTLKIDTVTYDHAPIFTVEEGRDLKAQWPGGHSKNLFLKDKKGALFLISAKDDTEINLKRLPKLIGCARLSFGREELMQQVLGVSPGSVTGFALINTQDPNAQKVKFFLDARLMACNPIHFHPLMNDATTAIAPKDFLTFARACGHQPEIIDFADVPE
jgi:Ala-tRNA(Pro) deacylase